MDLLSRGVRNAFRNTTRTVSIVVILGLAIGLALVMLIAHRAVNDKVKTTLSSVGNTVTIGPPGYSTGSMLQGFLTTKELAAIKRLPGVTGVDESLGGYVKANNPPPAGASIPVGKTKIIKGGSSSHRSGSSPVKTGSTSLDYPGTLAFATQGLACEPKPCTPPISYYTIYFSGSTEPTTPVNVGASTLDIVSGHPISGAGAADDAMISTQMAEKNGLRVGSTFTAFGRTLTVAAIFKTDTQQGHDTVIVSLAELQHLMRDSGGPVETAVVTTASLTQLPKVTSQIEHLLGSRASVVSYLADAERAVSALDSVKGIALDSLVGAVGASVVILLLVMLLIVRERKREIGILKAIGAGNGRVMAQFATEAVTLTLLGLVVGLVIGFLAASPVTSSLVSHSGVGSDTGARGLFGAGNPALSRLTHITGQVSGAVILEGLVAAVAIATLASGAAAWMISRIRPADVLRSE